jgi:hypothetical protein
MCGLPMFGMQLRWFHVLVIAFQSGKTNSNAIGRPALQLKATCFVPPDGPRRPWRDTGFWTCVSVWWPLSERLFTLEETCSN